MDFVTLNLDGTPRSVRADMWRVWLQPDPPEPKVQVQIQADPDARLDWSELSKLKRLVELHYRGGDERVLAYLAERPQIRTFEWEKHGRPGIDLSATGITRAWFDIPGPEFELLAPESGSLTQLSLSAPRPEQKVEVKLPDHGADLSLTMLCRGSKCAPGGIGGLSRLRNLDLWSVDTVRLGDLACFPDLEQLTIYGPPGRIEDLESLTMFPRLRKLRLQECYFLDASSFPETSQLPSLESVQIDGIREADAAIIFKRVVGGPKLSIRGKRSDGWLKANIDNPFRHWGDEYPKNVASAATSAYRRALAAIDRLPQDASTEMAREVMQAFVAAFNRVNRKHDLDTIMREEAGTAFEELAARLPAAIDRAVVSGWFDDYREF